MGLRGGGEAAEDEEPETRLGFSSALSLSSSSSSSSSSSLLPSSFSIDGGSKLLSGLKVCSAPTFAVSATLAVFFCVFYFNAVTPYAGPGASLPLRPPSTTVSSSSVLGDHHNHVFSKSSTNDDGSILPRERLGPEEEISPSITIVASSALGDGQDHGFAISSVNNNSTSTVSHERLSSEEENPLSTTTVSSLDELNHVFPSLPTINNNNSNNNGSVASHKSFGPEGEGKGRTEEGVQGSESEATVKSEECDFSQGSWVRDDSYPLYQPESCPFIDDGFRCRENGRPDDGYTRWRWQPLGCNMPRFDAREMLERLRGSRLVFVGDSIGRNQWESMLCMLGQAVANKTHSIYEEHGEPITKHKGFLSFRFADYNCTVEYYRSPFLVPQGHPPPKSPPSVRTSIKVDVMDWTSRLWRHADILVFNAGHWWNYEKTLRGGAYFEEGGKVNMSMDVKTGFKRAIQTWANWVENEVDSTKTQVFFRTYAPVHFRGGTWMSGGQCHLETEPEMSMSGWEEEEKWTNLVVASQIHHLKKKMEITSSNVDLLNITHLTNPRKDGHSSIYYLGKEERPMQRQDCSHWCLPGVPDTWNELLFATLLAKSKGPWANHIKA